MREVSVPAREWRWLCGSVLQAVVVLVVALFASGAHASSALAANVAVCGPASLPGMTYITAANRVVSCGTDANGNALVLQVSSQLVAMNVDDTTDDGGSTVGLAIGGAVLSVLAVAFCFRVVRNVINSSSEG